MASSPDNGSYLGTCEVFDPVADSWTSIAHLPIVGGVQHHHLYSTAQVLGTKIYLVGGEGYEQGAPDFGIVTYGATLEYNPASDSWATEFPTEFPLSVARRGLVSGVINQKMHAVGGMKWNQFPTPWNYYDENEELDSVYVPVTVSAFRID